MSRIDFGTFLTLVAMILLIVVIVLFMGLKLKDTISNRLNTADMYQQPTWTEITKETKGETNAEISNNGQGE